MHQIKYIKTPKMIEIETGRKFIEICKELIDEGLSPTEIANKLDLKTSRYISQYMYQENNKASESTVLYPELYEIIKLHTNDRESIEELFPRFSGGQSYKDFLYVKYITEGLSSFQIAALVGCTYAAIVRQLKIYGLTKTLSEARSDAEKKGLIDYRQIMTNGKKTRRKSSSNSNSQEIVRHIISETFTQFLIEKNISHLEIIVGLDEWSVLQDKEIDIPIVAIDLDKNQYFKFSIELDSPWHTDQQKDQLKKDTLTKRGWNHYSLWYNESNFYLEIEVKKVVNEILLILLGEVE